MTIEAVPAQPPSWRSWLQHRQLRLASGIILFVYLVTHLANHVLGLVSVAAMERGRSWFDVVWHNPLGALLLYGALLGHFGLALQTLYRVRFSALTRTSALRLGFGFLIPLLLIDHVTGTEIRLIVTGETMTYAEMLRGLWVIYPFGGVKQSLLIVIAWIHGVIGLAFWLRTKSWFVRVQPVLFALALLLPILALVGVAEGGKEMARRETARGPVVMPEARQELQGVRRSLYLVFFGGIGLVLLARLGGVARGWSQRVPITYPGARTVVVTRGFSVLDASRSAGIAHHAVCGGQGRCSTCRIRILRGLANLHPPGPQEQTTLGRINAGPDVRLACQVRPDHALQVVPLLFAHPASAVRLDEAAESNGWEAEAAILFCDLRGFTGISENRLPFDVVFLLNQYFAVVADAVAGAGGHLDKFIGDGAMALFGLETDPKTACAQAVAAAGAIERGVAGLTRTLRGEIGRPLRIAIGIHIGPVIVGRLGHGQAISLTAIGDAVNTASRLEAVAKQHDAELVISALTAELAGLDLGGFAVEAVTLRGRAAPIDVCIIDRVRNLPVASSA